VILRRLARNLKEQNWTAIAIEFVLLVLGVFLGIQVANWNVERETRVRSGIFTERLADDLRREVLRRDIQLAYYGEVRAAAEAAVAALEGSSPQSNEALLVNAYRATQYWHNVSQRATYDELVSTGSIGLVTDRRLVALAVSTFGNVSADDLRHQRDESPYRALFRMSIPNDLQRTLARQCGDRFPPGSDGRFLDYPCQLALQASAIDPAAETLRSDPQTLRLLRHRLADIDTRLSDLNAISRRLREGLDATGKSSP
jgi:hypothetical protein